MITKTANYYLYKEAGLGNFIGNAFVSAKNWALPRMHNMWNTASGWWRTGKMPVNGQPLTFANGMKNFATNAWDATRRAAQPMTNTMSNWWNSAVPKTGMPTVAQQTVRTPTAELLPALPYQY